MFSSVCIEQVEGYIYRLEGVPHAVDDDGDTVVVPLATKYFKTFDGAHVLPLRITVTESPCVVEFAVLKVPFPTLSYPGRRRARGPLRVALRRSIAFPDGLAVVAVPRENDPERDLRMHVPVTGASMTFVEFREALRIFHDVIDAWARRRASRTVDPPERPADESAEDC